MSRSARISARQKGRFLGAVLGLGRIGSVLATIRMGVAGLLCVWLPLPLVAEQAAPAKTTASGREPGSSADQRVLHLLNRFTFGPKPGDVEAVRELAPGNLTRAIDLWLRRQLQPDGLPDAVLTARLSEFPAMQLPVDELLERFPSGAEIRQAANGKRPIPRNAYLAAIYRRHIALYEDKQAEKAKEKSAEQAQWNAVKASGGGSTGLKAEAASGQAHETMEKPTAQMASNDGRTTAPLKQDPPHTAGEVMEKAAPAQRPTYADLLVKDTLSLRPQQRVDRILAMGAKEYEEFHANLKGPLRDQLTGDLDLSERELLADFDNPTRAVIQELEDQRILRDVLSTRQLQEVMTTFWLNHFNVYVHKNEEAPYYLVSYERDAIRPYALGKFENLLVATAQSPAMLLYLDNAASTGPHSMAAEKQQSATLGKENKSAPGLNENYARELMELHTLGVNGGYTQKDVTEVARIFTGWTVETPQQGGGAEFDPLRHEPGKKIVMGHTFKENGQKEGLQLLHMLATSAATAHFLSQELAVAFVSDAPPAALVNRMAAAFLKSRGDIPTVLLTMLHSPEFWAAEAYEAKVKTPLEYVISAARASGATVTDPRPLVNALNQMGMPLYGCVPPTGYSAKADAWVSTGALVTRMNFALSLAAGRLHGVKADWSAASAVDVASWSPPEAERALEARLIPAGAGEKTRAAVLDQAQQQGLPQAKPKPGYEVFPHEGEAAGMAATPQEMNTRKALASAPDRQNAQIAGLLLGSPEFQRR